MDALASPFVQGQLRGPRVEATVRTECGCCGRPLTLATDGASGCSVAEAGGGARPLVFAPLVDFDKWKEPSIIDGF